MLSAKECRQRVQDWLHLAATARDFFAQDALVRRAADCEDLARRRQKGTVPRAKGQLKGGKAMPGDPRALPQS